MSHSIEKLIHVAVAVIRNRENEILVSQRLQHAHQGGLWEFPGGKRETGETLFAALQREIKEELALDVYAAQPLISIAHDYEDRSVLLDVWTVSAYSGEPVSCEGQRFKWVSEQELSLLAMPAADIPIVTAVKLPERYVISSEPGWLQQACQGDKPSALKHKAINRFLTEFENTVRQYPAMVQLRLKAIDQESKSVLVQACLAIAKQHQCKLLLNASIEAACAAGADGVHLDGRQLLTMQQAATGADELTKEFSCDFMVAASCHDEQQLALAQELGVDFAVLSPVKETRSHPDSDCLGWEKFSELVSDCKIPVYALGGLGPDDTSYARQQGAQGVAGIRAFWN